eukprot:m.1662455 g.1662455  ORF g.1662455 m.1662455 type:complete len:65 (-) comp130111_c0_seq1:75-269(-)
MLSRHASLGHWSTASGIAQELCLAEWVETIVSSYILLECTPVKHVIAHSMKCSNSISNCGRHCN